MTKNEAKKLVKGYKTEVTVECFLFNGTPCSPPTGMNTHELQSLIEKAVCVHETNQNPFWSYDLMLCMDDHEVYVNTPNEPDSRPLVIPSFLILT